MGAGVGSASRAHVQAGTGAYGRRAEIPIVQAELRLARAGPQAGAGRRRAILTRFGGTGWARVGRPPAVSALKRRDRLRPSRGDRGFRERLRKISEKSASHDAHSAVAAAGMLRL